MADKKPGDAEGRRRWREALTAQARRQRTGRGKGYTRARGQAVTRAGMHRKRPSGKTGDSE